MSLIEFQLGKQQTVEKNTCQIGCRYNDKIIIVMEKIMCYFIDLTTNRRRNF